MSDESTSRMSGQSLFRLFSFMRLSLVMTCLLTIAADSAARQGEDVAVRRYPGRIIVEYRPRYLSGPPDDRSATAPLLLNGIAALGSAGTDVHLYRAVTVPLEGPRSFIRILESTYREEQGILPVRREIVRDPGMGGLTLKIERKVPEQAGREVDVAILTDVATTGSGIEGTLRFFPLRPSQAGVLRRYERIVVEIFSDRQHQAATPTVATDGPLAQGTWYRLDVDDDGIVKLDAAFFASAGISLTELADIRSIRVFGRDGTPLSENLLDPRDRLEEVARKVVDVNGNGSFDSGDYVLFYGASARKWTYQPGTKTWRHSINPYGTYNSYFLTFGGADSGRSMATVVSTSTPAVPLVPDVQGMQFHEEETSNLLGSGRQWFGRLMDAESPTATVMTLLPGMNAFAPINYRIAVAGRTGTTESVTVRESGSILGTIPISPVILNSISTNYAYVAPPATYTRPPASLQDNRSVLQFTFQTISGEAWLDWAEILYRRLPVAAGDMILFPSADTTAVLEHRITGFSSDQVQVFDVSDHDSVREFTGLRFEPGNPGVCLFQAQLTAGSPRWFLAVGPSGFKAPVRVERIGNSNVRGIIQGAEFVIVTPAEFRAEAERLAAHRRNRDSLTTEVIQMDHILNEYAGGLPDPMALRNMLADARATWSIPPRYVLLFGDAHFDFRNIRATVRNRIPTYQSAESVHQINTYGSDDALLMLNAGNPRISLAAGRLPVNTEAEARAVVDKIIAYETSAPFGEWRNRATFVADDGLTSTSDDGSIHTFQAEILSQTYTPAGLNKKKIYLIEYPTLNSASGRRKPSANEAIIDAVNAGTLMLNYTGHGNPHLWAHEAVFTRETSLPRLQNSGTPFFLVAATCDFARFDDPFEVSSGELLLTMSGGAIGVVTATRIVYSSDNFQFNNTLYTELFRTDSLGRPPRLGDAVFRTKQIHYDLNDVKYHLLGDPTMRLNLPARTAGVDSLNGNPLLAVTPVPALGKVSLAGGIRNPDSSRALGFTGQALLEMYDADRTVVVSEWNFPFTVNGSLLYRGEVSVTEGLFRAIIPVPKDVSYGANRARVALYAWTPNGDAAGFTDRIVISGTDTTAAPDTSGPSVEIFFDDETFRSGDVVAPEAELIVRLFDENGINTSTASVGHGLEATLNSTGEKVRLSEYYRGDRDTYQSGEARIALRDLPDGMQTMSVKAWDTYNNSTSTDIMFDVRSASDLRLYHVYNFPNPVSRSTVFTFQRNSAEPIDVEVRVYTVAGRQILAMRVPAVVDRFVRIPWDGRDQQGEQVANGVYFYKVITRSLGGDGTEEALGKLTVVR